MKNLLKILEPKFQILEYHEFKISVLDFEFTLFKN